jgi:hypothetical protein
MISAPNRKMGLLEMLLTYARAFAMLAASIEFNRGQINGQMLLGNYNAIKADMPLGEATSSSLVAVKELCGQIPSLVPVLDQIRRIECKLANGVMPLILHNELEALQHRILDELKRHFYYPVTEAYAAIYASSMPWDEAVHNAFPSARVDIQNGARCIILGQATAGVFHLMRVMEVGLKVLGREAGIPYAPSWESFLEQLGKKFKADHKAKTVAWKRKEPLLKDLSGDLAAIKIAWRNPTMHIEREYSVEEAEQVYNAVRTFIQRMAQSFREKGKPIAVRVCLPDPPAE